MKAVGICDIGRIRKINQDNIFFSNEQVGILPNLFIVADGMGGHNAGEYASKFAIEFFLEYIKNVKVKDIKSFSELLKKGIEKINKMIYNKALNTDEFFGMGTTFLVATIINDIMYVANVGDSRLYLFNNDFTKITIDHSLVEEMLKKGRITEEEAKHHPKKNIITRAVGVELTVNVDVFEEKLSDDTYILMCSDGLTNMIEEDDIALLINRNKDIESTVKELVDKANKKGGYDNISVILIERIKE